MDAADLRVLAETWGVPLSEESDYGDFLLLIERICRANNGYFVFKVDGERATRRYTFALNLPYPTDFVFRTDVDSISDGMSAMLGELCAADLKFSDREDPS